MRKITIMEHISLDGVIQAPGGRYEDGDYEYGGWIAPYRSAAVTDAVAEAHNKKFDLLLGRHTYDIWAGYWPKAGDNPMAGGLNAATKYVATHRPESLGWSPVTSLGTDVIQGVRNLKSTDGPDLILWGSSTLASALIGEGLADEVLLFIYPVVLGQGKRLFPEGAHARSLSLVGTMATSTGVLINTYRYVGPLQTESV